MPTEESSISDFLNLLPRKLQVRFTSLGSYVRALVTEIKLEHHIEDDFGPTEIQIIQLVAFIYALERFMRVGSHAARKASVAFNAFGLEGFQVGSTQFTKNNLNTTRGRRLANMLRASIVNTPVERIVKNSHSLKNLVEAMIFEIRKNG
jgi:hypothetical protein